MIINISASLQKAEIMKDDEFCVHQQLKELKTINIQFHRGRVVGRGKVRVCNLEPEPKLEQPASSKVFRLETL